MNCQRCSNTFDLDETHETSICPECVEALSSQMKSGVFVINDCSSHEKSMRLSSAKTTENDTVSLSLDKDGTVARNAVLHPQFPAWAETAVFELKYVAFVAKIAVLEKTKNEVLMLKAIADGNRAFIKALAKNPNVPESMVDQLIEQGRVEMLANPSASTLRIQQASSNPDALKYISENPKASTATLTQCYNNGSDFVKHAVLRHPMCEESLLCSSWAHSETFAGAIAENITTPKQTLKSIKEHYITSWTVATKLIQNEQVSLKDKEELAKIHASNPGVSFLYMKELRKRI